MKPLTIRIATLEDAGTLNRLNIAFNETSDGADNIARRLADPDRVDIPLLAEVAGQAVGFACLRVLPNLFYAEMYAKLTELYIEPDARRRGLGRALVAYAEEIARERGAKGLKILTGDDNNEGQGLYRRMGYVDEEEIVLWKRL